MECIPTLYPSVEEFANPIEYLSEQKIKRLGHIYGMIKLVPPPGFRPPFSINTSDFKFNVRVQKLSELNISNRSRLFFMKQINNFNRTKRGKSCSIKRLTEPYFFTGEGQKIYFYDLFIEIAKSGNGHSSGQGDQNQLPRRGKRTRSGSPDTSSPFSLLDLNEVVNDSSLWKRISRTLHTPIDELQHAFKNYISNYYAFISKQVKNGDSNLFSRLLYQDKYPKSLLSDDEKSLSESDDSEDDEGCVICHRSNNPTKIILCDSCDRPFHISCLSTPLTSVPKGDWICNNCIIGNGYYGFREESHEYTLSEFRSRCNSKEKELTSDVNTGERLSIEKLEEKFWYFVDNMEDSITVKYGADVNGTSPGEMTGFPTAEYVPSNLDEEQKYEHSKYYNHPMNLINLPNAKGSLLPMFDRRISGMTIPWMYVGSTFSTFCWHLEDQYTLSANYQHEGAPKIWYSIPEYSCDKFQKLMRDVAPDLFEKQPDLMHQLVTLISPYDRRFKEAKIKCFKAVQNPNEYIITFPKCYHAGFNSGYNFNEAVNFTLDSWVPYGIEAISDYQNTGKQCVFDMFELMMNILNSYLAGNSKFQESLVRTCYSELLNALNSKIKMINHISGVIPNKSYSNRVLECRSKQFSLPSPKKEKDEQNLISESAALLEESREEEEYDVYCNKCGTICFLAFVAHYKNPHRLKKRRLLSYTPKKLNELADGRELEILCLKDYHELVEKTYLEENECQAEDESNEPFENDELVYLRNSQEVEDILRVASKKIDHFRI